MQKYFEFFKKFTDFFRRNGTDDRSLMAKLRDKYRLVIMNDETFEEVTSLKLSPLHVYTFISSLVVGTAILVTMLIVYTPLKRYIPGYGDFRRDAEINELAAKARSVERELFAHRKYNENFRKILTGDLADFSKAKAEKQGATDTLSALPSDVERISEDDQLRAAVARGPITASPFLAASKEKLQPSGPEVPLENIDFIPPVTGEITAHFDTGKDHFGIDVAAPRNTAVKTVADGVVVSAGYTVETGHSIAVQHPNNILSMYKHNSVLLKKAGDKVKAGEALAIIGNTGESSSGPHLHFELWYRGRAVNPADYFTFQ